MILSDTIFLYKGLHYKEERDSEKIRSSFGPYASISNVIYTVKVGITYLKYRWVKIQDKDVSIVMKISEDLKEQYDKILKRK